MKMLEKQLSDYIPGNNQETQDRLMMLEALARLDNPLSRNNKFAHFTASNWIVNPDHTKVLMAWHNIYNTWAWTGGHADGESDLLAVALREAKEETGIERIRPVSNGFFSIEILPVSPHIRRQRFVSAHLHLNVTFLMCADDRQPLSVNADENSAVSWLPLHKAEDNRDEPFMTVIYRKLNRRLAAFPI